MGACAVGSLRQQAQGLPPRRDGCGEFDAGAHGLSLGVGGLGLDAQARGQVGFAQAVGLVEEAARFARQLGATIGSGQLRPRRVGARASGFALARQAGKGR